MPVANHGSVWALGLMSGTSMDGIDAALLRTDGVSVSEFGPSAYRAYAEDEHAELRAALLTAREAATGSLRSGRPGWLRSAERMITDRHAEAVEGLIDASGVTPAVVGFHGQTIVHRPAERLTMQIGDGAALAKRVGAPVAWDFRSDDVAQGGQGAPLAPLYHAALARRIAADSGEDGPFAFLNIGGVANVTWADPTAPDPHAPDALIAFDTGPGNALIDDFVRSRTGASQDDGGALAAKGLAGANEVAAALAPFKEQYGEVAGPKSLDRFSIIGLDLADHTTEDGAALLTALTVECVAWSLERFPSPPARWIVCGGGRLNLTMMARLQERLGAPVDAAEAVGLDGDMIEAQAFAFLAVRALRGLPVSTPGVTGAEGRAKIARP